MTFETKEQVLEKILCETKPVCPHCGEEMNLWEVPEIPMGDGLGWGTPYLFLCFNDACSLYLQGWDNMKENYGRTSSYRCMCYPGTQQFELMPVFGPTGGKGQIIDEQVLAEQQAREEAMKRGFSALAGCYRAKDWVTVLHILLDAVEPLRVRIKAAEMLGDIGELEVIDPLTNLKFGPEALHQAVKASVANIHERYFTRECPYCSEIIKRRANVCKHCGRDVAGA